jgi:hypothetical protein
VRTDPEPDESIRFFDGHRTVIPTHARRPEAADALEMQRRILWGMPEPFIGLIGEMLDLRS